MAAEVAAKSKLGLRVVPLALLNRWLRRFERDVGAGVFYLHPWEFDADSPTAWRPSRWLLRLGRRRLAEQFSALMRDIQFRSIEEVFGSTLRSSQQAVGGQSG